MFGKKESKRSLNAIIDHCNFLGKNTSSRELFSYNVFIYFKVDIPQSDIVTI